MLRRLAIGFAALAVVVGGLAAPAEAHPRHPHPPRCAATKLCLYPYANYHGRPLVLRDCGFTDLQDTRYDNEITSYINKVAPGTAVIFYETTRRPRTDDWYELFESVGYDRDPRLAPKFNNRVSGVEIAC